MAEEKYLETLKKMRLIDDTFFSACFDNNEEDVEYILRIILEKSDLKVLKVQTQKSVENMYGRSVRFDVFATDDAGKLYNIEVQRTDAGAVPTRARFNSSMLDYHRLKKKAKYKELPETYVIFFTENDVLKSGEKIYHIDRVVRETQKLFEDGTHIIYVNGSYKGEEGKPLDDLIHDFFCINPEEMRHRQLAERVEFLKSNKSGVRKMSKIIQEIFAEEIAAGKAEEKKATLLENIRNLMETLNLTAQQAMDALKIPANEQEKYIALI
jgi:predicted transposase/invertase (TIGR01784 family)